MVLTSTMADEWARRACESDAEVESVASFTTDTRIPGPAVVDTAYQRLMQAGLPVEGIYVRGRIMVYSNVMCESTEIVEEVRIN